MLRQRRFPITRVRWGYPGYYDMNHDGTLSQEDLVYLGNADPWLYGGIQNSFNIRNLSIGVYFTYSLGG